MPGLKANVVTGWHNHSVQFPTKSTIIAVQYHRRGHFKLNHVTLSYPSAFSYEDHLPMNQYLVDLKVQEGPDSWRNAPKTTQVKKSRLAPNKITGYCRPNEARRLAGFKFAKRFVFRGVFLWLVYTVQIGQFQTRGLFTTFLIRHKWIACIYRASCIFKSFLPKLCAISSCTNFHQVFKERTNHT